MATQTPPQNVASAAQALLAQGVLPGRSSAGDFRVAGANPSGLGGSPAGVGAGVGAGGATHPATELVAADGARPGTDAIAGRDAGRNLDAPGDLPGLHLAPAFERMPVGLMVSIPVRNFRVRHLLAARAGELIETQWGNGEDLPLAAGEVQLAWCEFEVVDTRLAVRVTRLA